MLKKLSLLFLSLCCFASEIPPLEIGDFVFREGIGSESLLIKKLGGFRYTHIAMVVETTPQTLLIHATTDDNKDKPNQVILSNLNDFMNLSHKIAIKRPNFSNEEKAKIVRLAMEYLGKQFIIRADEDAFYCTTLLEKAINEVKPYPLQKTYLNIPFFKGYYLFPKAFFDDNQSVLIYESEEKINP